MPKTELLQPVLPFKTRFISAFTKQKIWLTTHLLLCAVCIFFAVWKSIQGNYRVILMAALTILFSTCVPLFQALCRIHFPTPVSVLLSVFFLSAILCGTGLGFYALVPGWDIYLHAVSGAILALVAYPIASFFELQQSGPHGRAIVYRVIVALCVAATIGVFWEFAEMIGDILFHGDSQKDTLIHSFYSYFLVNPDGSTPGLIEGIEEVIINGKKLGVGGYIDIGLIDTMKDMFFNLLGGIIALPFVAIHEHNPNKCRFIKHFLPQKYI